MIEIPRRTAIVRGGHPRAIAGLTAGHPMQIFGRPNARSGDIKTIDAAHRLPVAANDVPRLVLRAPVVAK